MVNQISQGAITHLGISLVFGSIVTAFTGASMNPARSLAPALVTGLWQHHWVYWVAPILGAQLAGVIYRHLSNDFSDFKN